MFFVLFSFVDSPSVLWYCWLGDFWPVKTVSHITYTVLEGTLNTAHSLTHSGLLRWGCNIAMQLLSSFGLEIWNFLMKKKQFLAINAHRQARPTVLQLEHIDWRYRECSLQLLVTKHSAWLVPDSGRAYTAAIVDCQTVDMFCQRLKHFFFNTSIFPGTLASFI